MVLKYNGSQTALWKATSQSTTSSSWETVDINNTTQFTKVRAKLHKV